MEYACLVYLEREKLHAVKDSECAACGDGFPRCGLLVAAEALQPIEAAPTVRVRDGKVLATAVRLPRRENSEGSVDVRPVRGLAALMPKLSERGRRRRR